MSLIQSISQLGQSFIQKNDAAGPSFNQLKSELGSELAGTNPADLIQKAESSLRSLGSQTAGTEATDFRQVAGLADIAPGRVAPSDARFGSLIKDFVNEVEAAGRTSGESVRGLLMGESDNIHQTMIAMGEAKTAFTLMVEVRNKMVEAYQEIMRMQV